MTIAAETLQADIVWATLLWIGVAGWTVNWAIHKVEQRALWWYWSQRA
jgi:ABC-type nitrate/sulfonate/bicarbonate transport system permease component